MAAPLRLRVAPWLADAPALGRRASLSLQVALVVLAIAALARLALPIPGTPVPITLQDLGVLLVGILLGPRRGALAVGAYVAAGALGAPVFSNGNGGMAWLMGPTGGYLLAFPPAAWVVGVAARPGRPLLLAAAGVLAAQAVIFTGGVLQLALLTGRGLPEVAALAVSPFLPGVAIKGGLLVAFCAALAARRGARGESRLGLGA